MNRTVCPFVSSGISHNEIVKLSSEYRPGLRQSVQKDNEVKFICPANLICVLFSTVFYLDIMNVEILKVAQCLKQYFSTPSGPRCHCKGSMRRVFLKRIQ